MTKRLSNLGLFESGRGQDCLKEQTIEEYATNRLRKDDLYAVENHLEECVNCKERVEKYKKEKGGR